MYFALCADVPQICFPNSLQQHQFVCHSRQGRFYLSVSVMPVFLFSPLLCFAFNTRQRVTIMPKDIQVR